MGLVSRHWAGRSAPDPESGRYDWVDREVSGCEFRDARLGCPFRKLLAQIGGAMGQSIPLACQDWANTKGAYRIFSNDRVARRIFSPVIFSRRESARSPPRAGFWCSMTRLS